MEKRVILAIVICAGIFILWQQLFPQPKPVPAPSAPVTSSTPATTPSAAPAAAPSAPAGTAAAAPTTPVVNHPEQEVDLLTPAVRFVLSSAGGTLKHAQLREDKYLSVKGDPSSGFDVVRTAAPGTASMRLAFPGSSFAAPSDGSWEVSRPAPDTVVFTAETDAVRIEKRYRAESASYRLQLDVTIENKAAKPANEHLAIQLFAHQDPNGKGGGFLGGSSANTASVLCYVADKVERTPVEKLAKETVEKVGNVR